MPSKFLNKLFKPTLCIPLIIIVIGVFLYVSRAEAKSFLLNKGIDTYQSAYRLSGSSPGLVDQQERSGDTEFLGSKYKWKALPDEYVKQSENRYVIT